MQYQESALPNKKLATSDKGKLVIQYPARLPDELEKCKDENCVINAEFLKPNQAVAFDFYKLTEKQPKTKISFVCYENSESVSI